LPQEEHTAVNQHLSTSTLIKIYQQEIYSINKTEELHHDPALLGSARRSFSLFQRLQDWWL
jgi:hypothetical protein